MSVYIKRKKITNQNSERMITRKPKKYHTVGTIPNLNIKIVERYSIDTPNTQIHDCSVKQIVWAQTFPLIGMM